MPRNQTEDFLNAINADAERRRSEIERDTNEYIARKTDEAEARISRETYMSLQRRAAQIRSRIGREVSTRQQQRRQELFGLRSQLTEELFCEARRRIEQAVQSQEYARILAVLVSEAVSAVGGTGTVYGRADDEGLIVPLLTDGCTFQCDDSIQLGGVRAVSSDGTLAADNRLESRLNAEREWFVNNSRLTLN